MGPLRRGVRELGLALITAGVVVLLFVVYQLWGTNFTEHAHQRNLAKQFTAAVVTKPPATSGSASPPVSEVLPSVPQGGAIDHLEIPSIGFGGYVVEGVDENDLREGPGHYPGTAYPGQVGNTAIAGHRTTYGAPFYSLNNLKAGDQILITDLAGHTWVYLVDQAPFVVDPSDVSVLNPTSDAELTLTTCNPRFEATSRLIVKAKLQGQAGHVVSTPSTSTPPQTIPGDDTVTPATAPAADTLGTGQSSAVAPSLLYGLAFVVLWVITRIGINRTRKWWRLLAYVVGMGVCLIPLWLCFENIVLLLPQSI
jgi:sortase A